MKRSFSIWLGFALCLAIVLAAMGWISLSAVRSDRAETETRRQAAVEDKVRLALWRIDSALAPMLAQESARSNFANQAFNPPSYVLLYFQVGPDGAFTSPQAPAGPVGAVPSPEHAKPKRAEKARALLNQLAAAVDRRKLLTLLPRQPVAPTAESLAMVAPSPGQRIANRERRADFQQRGQDAADYNFRNEAVQQNANNTFLLSQSLQPPPPGGPELLLTSTGVSGVLMTPLWIGERLVLARRITARGREYVQGCLLDWPAIKSSLLETIEDLLPGADLQPAPGASAAGEPRMLAALPLRIVPRGVAEGGDGGAFSALALSLAVAWTCVLLAAAAVAGLLWGVMRLSERRAAFVSAVTHELRTPLTTFQMYAEMLAEGMVPDAEQQRRYLQTLRGEALRLTHLVENVLAYARLERGRIDGRVESLAVEDLLGRLQGRLAAHAEQAGMELLVDVGMEAADVTVRANPSAVEQVLFNLVDNACKYAPAATDRRIHVTTKRCAGGVEVSVRDHGPGIAAAARRRLFRSFSKSVEEAAHSAPGIGLGLALSRRLARDMGGDLRLDPSVNDGACFVLSLSRQ
jgi:signal transduction histidine kinase